MKFNRVFRFMFLAGVFATLCVMISVGVYITLAAGIIGLVVVSRRETLEASFLSEYLYWLLCIISFAVMTLALLPWAYFPAIGIAFCILSPLFGTIVYTVERSSSRPTQQKNREKTS